MSSDLNWLARQIDSNHNRLERRIGDGLSVLKEHLGRVASMVDFVNDRVAEVAQEQVSARQELLQLGMEFRTFVASDLRQKEMQFAATRLADVKQELERRFGHYKQVRRSATGVLQASDVAIVRGNTMRLASEETMLSCPGYWLAPALAALTFWVQDDQALAERALAEAIRRDDTKVSLFFTLVCRRAVRMEASAHWLKRYLQSQTPQALDREAVVMLDALANGVFGAGTIATCSTIIDEWLRQLDRQAGFPEEQRRRWAEVLDVLAPQTGAGEYPSLREYSPTWPALDTALGAARRNAAVLSFFEQVFQGETALPPTMEAAVDALLDSLVSNFDDEELPLCREERLLELVVEESGDKAAAVRRFDAESGALEEQSDLAAMLTNVAMYPGQYGTTQATERYAVAQCRHWIIAGHQDLVARDRAGVPVNVELRCGSATCSSRDGTNEKELVQEVAAHYLERIKQAVSAVKMAAHTGTSVAAGVVLGVFIAVWGSIPIGVICIAGAGGYLYFQYVNQQNNRQRVADGLAKERVDSLRILRACLAELADLRREMAAEDARADEVTSFLSSLSSPQFVLQGPKTIGSREGPGADPWPKAEARAGEAEAEPLSGEVESLPPDSPMVTGSPLAIGLPAWDLRPPHTVLVRRPAAGGSTAG